MIITIITTIHHFHLYRQHQFSSLVLSLLSSSSLSPLSSSSLSPLLASPKMSFRVRLKEPQRTSVGMLQLYRHQYKYHHNHHHYFHHQLHHHHHHHHCFYHCFYQSCHYHHCQSVLSLSLHHYLILVFIWHSCSIITNYHYHLLSLSLS